MTTSLLQKSFAQDTLAQDSLYHYSLVSMAGDSVHLRACEGKKVLLVVLPTAVADTAVQGQLRRLQDRYDSSVLVIVGVPALDHGYDADNDEAVQALYATNMQKGMVLAGGVSISKASGAAQAGFMRWLTDKDLNGHYDEDAEVGKKFIVGASGALYAVLGSESSLDDPIIDIILAAGQ